MELSHPIPPSELLERLHRSVFKETGLRYLECLAEFLCRFSGAEAALVCAPCPKRSPRMMVVAGHLHGKPFPCIQAGDAPCRDSLDYGCCPNGGGFAPEASPLPELSATPLRYDLQATSDQMPGLILLYLKDAGSAEKEIQALLDTLRERTLAELHRLAEERTLTKQLELYRKLCDTSPAPLYFKDLGGNYLLTNQAFGNLFGRPSQEIHGKSVEALLPGPLAAEYKEKDRQMMESGLGQHFETSLTDATGGRHEVIFQKNLVTDPDGAPEGIVGTVIDITSRKNAERRIRQMAYYDQLTGLPNQSLFCEHLGALIEGQRHRQTPVPFTVMLIEIGRHNVIQDSLGMSYAAMITKAMAQRLSNWVELGDLVARLEGNRFALCLSQALSVEIASRLGQRILDLLSFPITLKDMEVHCTGHVGIALFPEGGESALSLLKNADIALWGAKNKGSSGFQFFSQEMTEKAMERRVLETHLRQALSRKELYLNYQPQFDLTTGEICGVEALMRWNCASRGQISPAVFIPMAEESGLIFPIGEWLIEEACTQAGAWQKAGLPPITMAINLSGLQFRHSAIVDTIHRALQKTGLAPQWLELELTESIVMEQTEENLRTMDRLKDMGISLAIDDFGTGYSSLGYLKRFPIDTLKIDRSFIRDIPFNKVDVAITDAIIAMAHRLGLKVTAEGVETQEQSQFLMQHRCDVGQGFLWGRPVSSAEIEARLGKTDLRAPLSLPVQTR